MPTDLYAFQKPRGHMRRFDAPYLRCNLAITIKVSKSCGKYVSLAPTVRSTWDLVRSPIALYLGCWFPCCSAMQNLGDSTVNVLSCCVAGVGFDNRPFSCSATDISQDFVCKVGLVVRCRCREMFLLRAAKLILSRFELLVGNILRFVSDSDGWMLPEIPTPLIKSQGSCLSL